MIFGLYWSEGLMFTSRSARIDEILGCPEAGIVFNASLNTFGVDVCVGTSDSSEVVKASDEAGLHSGTPLISCPILNTGHR